MAHDFGALCAVEQEPHDCEEELAAGAGLTAPRQRPALVEARQVGGFEQLWLFSVKGRDGKDRPYASEVLVTAADDELKVVNAVWWTSRQLGPLRGD